MLVSVRRWFPRHSLEVIGLVAVIGISLLTIMTSEPVAAERYLIDRSRAGTPTDQIQDPQNPCSIVCVAMASYLLGKPISLADARQVIHPDGLGRATLGQLAHGLEVNGFVVAPVLLQPDQLQQLPVPAILHLDGAHFVVCKPHSLDEVVLFDPPERPLMTSGSDLGDRWNGVALLVGRSEKEIKDSLVLLGID